jgi:hypothetical protein
MTWVFVSRIADEFILGLDIPRAQQCVLLLGNVEDLLCRLRA